MLEKLSKQELIKLNKSLSEKLEPKNISLCKKCYNPHRLQDEDAGSLREELRLCIYCFNSR